MNSPSSPSLKASREHAARTSSGYVMLVLLLAVLAFGVYFAFFQSRAASWIFIVVVCTLVSADREGILCAAAQRSGGDPAVRQLPGHRPGDRPALGLAVDEQREGFGARQQRHLGPDQGQRSARQSHRNRWCGG
jgi:hypothetical protein